jgi:outer membrane protein assembly factor BamB
MGISKETGLLKEWTKEGPRLLWKTTEVGAGYSTPVFVEGHIYLLGNRGDQEFVFALDAKNGKQVWSTPIGKVGKNFGPQYPGARSTPTVDGAVMYVLGSDGDLVCLEKTSGQARWKKSLRKDFGGVPGDWAYAESPLIDGEVLVCTPGGAKATLVALNKKDGEVIWRSAVPGGDKAGYASLIIAEAGGEKEYVQFVQRGVVGVDAKTGRFLWRYDKTKDIGANIPTPVFRAGYVYSCGSRSGSGLVKLTPENGGVSAVPVYYTKTMMNSIGGAVLIGDHLYGTSNELLVCMEFATGKVKWEGRSVGKGAVCYADGHLYLRSEAGPVALVEATPQAYKEKGRFTQPDRSKIPAWPHPVVANGCLLLRDQELLLCYDVRDSIN